MDSDRIDLEAKVAFLERTLDALSDELREQRDLIETLRTRLGRAEARLLEKGEQGEIEPHDTPPPHY